MQQEQFLTVIDRDEAERRFRSVLDLRPLDAEEVPLGVALGHVLAEDVVSKVDVPGFDRSDVDGFAVRAEDTFGADETSPRHLRLNPETLATGIVPRMSVEAGTATPIATGAVLPRGADAVVMVEFTDMVGAELKLTRPVAPGANVTFAGADVGRGELVLRRGDRLGARDTGVLAAIGAGQVKVVRWPRVAIISTGNELIQPGATAPLGTVYDSNATVLADAVRELGGDPIHLGIVPDEFVALESSVRRALECDVVLLSGGTSKGPGDISYRVLEKLGSPGIVAHGVALKPGKPLCLAAVILPGRRPVPVAVLPGFPTSAMFTFHQFLAPVIRELAGRRAEPARIVSAKLPMRVNSERGRTEYLLVGLVENFASPNSARERQEEPMPRPESKGPDWVAFPMGKGSGSVTTFAKADGFVVIPRQREYLEAGEIVNVQLIDAAVRPADLVVIGSHCPGLDFLLSVLDSEGVTSKFMAVGSTGGLEAAKRHECDLAGVHLLDEATDKYNVPFLTPELTLIRGYGRLQGLVFRIGDRRFEGRSIEDGLTAALADPKCVLVNRNRGSGTRILIDRLLKGARPPGYLAETRSHNSVAAAVAQGRADWGVSIAPVALDAGLGFIPLREESYDFVTPKFRRHRSAVVAFEQLLARPETGRAMKERGFRIARS
jgi:putative molybdopterin biosynthesis protein